MEKFIKWTYLPLLLIGGNGLAISLVDSSASKLWLVSLALLIIIVSFMAEHLLPYEVSFNKSQQDSRRDTLHAIVNESLNVLGWLLLPLLKGLLTIAPLWPESWPLAFQLLLAVLIADIGITLAHYASHHIRFLWRLHAVHHSVIRLYGFNGLMKHPLHQLIETTAGVLPLIFIGVTQEVLALLVIAVVIQLLLQHSNVDYASGPFKYILAINKIHRFHHLGSAKEGDVNFGLFTTLIDRFLGTAYYDQNRVFGIKDLGIETEPYYPKSYVQQLIYPFRKINR
jgi:sterol desaturase/sphingolipid hydroxylase (fatty acid hydroxylase superfamily)